MGKIFYIMGKSCTGKDTIYERLLEMKELQLKEIVLYTTRPIRKGETEGKEYYFVTDKKLQELKKAGQIIESRVYHTAHGLWTYFTVDDGQIRLEKENYLGIGTLESYREMKKYYGRQALCPIYIEVEDGARLKRAVRREDKQDVPKYVELCRRFLADTEDFQDHYLEQAGIEKRFPNSELETCMQQIKEYIEQMR